MPMLILWNEMNYSTSGNAAGILLANQGQIIDKHIRYDRLSMFCKEHGNQGIQMTIFPRKRKEFYASLAKLLRNSNIGLEDALTDLASIQSGLLFRSAVSNIASAVNAGSSLHQALRDQSLYFPSDDVEYLQLSQEADALPDALEVLSTGKDSSISRHLLSWSLIGGSILLILGVFALILVAIVPKFEKMYQSMLWGEPLPALTRLVVWLSHLLTDHLIIVVCAIPIACAFYIGIKSIGPRLFHDRAVNVLPSSRDHALERDCLAFCQHMSIMLMCEKTVMHALKTAVPKARTGALRYHLQHWIKEIDNGEPMTLAVMTKKVKVGPLNLLQTALARPESFHKANDFSDLAITYGERTYISAPAIHGEAFPILFALTAFGLGSITLGILAPLIKLVEALG